MKEAEFEGLRARLSLAVEALATVQEEFGGVTIPREMFLEKKTANSYNYSQEFPPTLRDLVARVRSSSSSMRTLADFRWDYQRMVTALGPLLKEEYADRLTFIQWELDDIVEKVVKPEEQEEAEEEEEELEFDLERVKREQVSPVKEGLGCQSCGSPTTPNSCYSCLR